MTAYIDLKSTELRIFTKTAKSGWVLAATPTKPTRYMGYSDKDILWLLTQGDLKETKINNHKALIPHLLKEVKQQLIQE